MREEVGRGTPASGNMLATKNDLLQHRAPRPVTVTEVAVAVDGLLPRSMPLPLEFPSPTAR